MKTLRFNAVFDTLESRYKMALTISQIVNAHQHCVPYLPNAQDTFFWTVDSGNDWKVKFLQDQPGVLELWYRYDADGRNPHENALIPWLMVRLGAILIDTETHITHTELKSDNMDEVIRHLYNMPVFFQ